MLSHDFKERLCDKGRLPFRKEHSLFRHAASALV
jgi:hypothetical protein